MNDLQVEVCPETGMCTIYKKGVGKVDLLADEAGKLRDAAGGEGIREALSEIDSQFASGLNETELNQIGSKLKQT